MPYVFFSDIYNDLDGAMPRSKFPIILVPVVELSSPDLLLMACSWQKIYK